MDAPSFKTKFSPTQLAELVRTISVDALANLPDFPRSMDIKEQRAKGMERFIKHMEKSARGNAESKRQLAARADAPLLANVGDERKRVLARLATGRLTTEQYLVRHEGVQPSARPAAAAVEAQSIAQPEPELEIWDPAGLTLTPAEVDIAIEALGVSLTSKPVTLSDADFEVPAAHASSSPFIATETAANVRTPAAPEPTLARVDTPVPPLAHVSPPSADHRVEQANVAAVASATTAAMTDDLGMAVCPVAACTPLAPLTPLAWPNCWSPSASTAPVAVPCEDDDYVKPCDGDVVVA